MQNYNLVALLQARPASSCNVHGTLWVIPCTLSSDTEHAHKRLFSALYKIPVSIPHKTLTDLYTHSYAHSQLLVSFQQ